MAETPQQQDELEDPARKETQASLQVPTSVETQNPDDLEFDFSDAPENLSSLENQKQPIPKNVAPLGKPGQVTVDIGDVKKGNEANVPSYFFDFEGTTEIDIGEDFESKVPEGVLLSTDLPVPEYGMLKNTPEVRAILRSLRGEIRKTLESQVEKKSQDLRQRYQELVYNLENLSEEEQQEKEKISEELLNMNFPYRGVELIGSGGMGRVYRARDPYDPEHYVALKISHHISKDLYRRLLNEAKTLIGLENEGILKGYTLRKLGEKGLPGIPNSQNAYLIETEYIEGETMKSWGSQLREAIEILKKKLQSEKKLLAEDLIKQATIIHQKKGDLKHFFETVLPDSGKKVTDLDDDEILSENDAKIAIDELERAKEVLILKKFIKVAEGLEHAHERGLIHRDVKPDNLMISQKGDLKIIDWGLLKSEEEALLNKVLQTKSKVYEALGEESPKMDIDISMEDDVLGTPFYMSPEHMTGEEVGPTTDVWSLAVTLIDVMTEVPFIKGDSVREILQKGGIEKEYNWEEVNTAFKDKKILAILSKALNSDPEKRSSMKAFREALENYLREKEKA